MRTSTSVALAVATIALAASTCAPRRDVVVTGTDRAVGADGHIEVVREDGGNYLVTIEAQNVPPPARLGDGLTTYVVWFRPAEQQPLRMGILAYDEDARTGEMRATTTNTSFEVLVTAETAADVASPSDIVIFRTSVEAPQ